MNIWIILICGSPIVTGVIVLIALFNKSAKAGFKKSNTETFGWYPNQDGNG